MPATAAPRRCSAMTAPISCRSQSRRPVRAGKPARRVRISRGRQVRRPMQPARARPRGARPRAPGRHHSAVDDDRPHPGRRAELLRGVPRPLAEPQERERIAAGAAAHRSRRQCQGRHAGADQPRDPHAAQRHHRLCRGDDRRALRRARQRALCRIHEGHPRLRRAGDLASSTICSTCRGSKPASSTSPSPTRTSTSWWRAASR